MLDHPHQCQQVQTKMVVRRRHWLTCESLDFLAGEIIVGLLKIRKKVWKTLLALFYVNLLPKAAFSLVGDKNKGSLGLNKLLMILGSIVICPEKRSFKFSNLFSMKSVSKSMSSLDSSLWRVGLPDGFVVGLLATSELLDVGLKNKQRLVDFTKKSVILEK